MAPKTAPKAKAKVKPVGKATASPVPGRVVNAASLRKAYVDVKQSPDGIDPEPLTVPKCVECAHCGWPVYPRSSKVATRRTFERAGIFRDDPKAKKKDENAETKEEGAEGGGEDDDDNNSVDTEDQLRDDLEDMTAAHDELKENNHLLEEAKIELTARVDELEKLLSEAEEKVEFLEAAEMRLRDKNSALRVEISDMTLGRERLDTRIGDLETDMVKKLIEIDGLRKTLARFNRRRGLMLQQIDTELDKRYIGLWRPVTGVDKSSKGRASYRQNFCVIAMGLWRTYTNQEIARRAYEKLDALRVYQVNRLESWMSLTLTTLQAIQAEAERLRAKLKAAGHKLLARSCNGSPWGPGHALRAWSGSHAAIKGENALRRTTAQLCDVDSRLHNEEERADRTVAERDHAKNQRDQAKAEGAAAHAQIEVLMEQMAKFGKQANSDREEMARLAEERARKAREEAKAKMEAELARIMAIAKAEFEESAAALQDQIDGLEAQLKVAKASGGGPSQGKEDDLSRVVPLGQGTLCCGCLKQLVMRKVKPLDPLTALKGPSPSMDRAKREFFEKELKGMVDPDDPLHAYMWSAHKDPFGLTRYRSCSAADPSWGRTRSTPKLSPLQPDFLKDFKPSSFR